LLSSDDQLYLYETVSVLIVSCNLQPVNKAQLMKSLLEPTVGCFETLLNKYNSIPIEDEKNKLIYANCLNTVMLVASRASKGFSNQIKVKDCDCVEIFIQILRIFIPAININTHKSLISAGLRQYLHRMIVCLDNEVLEYLPPTIEYFIKNSSEPKDLYDLMPLINQILNKYKQQIVPFMSLIIMPLLNAILNFVQSTPIESITQSNILKITPLQLTTATAIVPQNNLSTTTSNNTAAKLVNGSGSEISIDAQFVLDTQLLYKSYFQFVLNIVNNDLMDIIAAQNSNDLYKIYYALIQAAQNGTLEIIKCCFQIIRKFITVFGK
jgi:exportin-T